MKDCPYCGRQLEDPAWFCDWCGTQQPALQPTPAPPVSYGPAQWPPFPRRTQLDLFRLLLVLLPIGLVLGAGIGAAFSQGVQRTVTQTVATTNVVTSLQQVMVTRTTTSMIQLPGAGLIEYAFSPDGNCAALVVKWIGKANSTIHILIYSFTLDNVRDALIQAKNRGIDVKIVMEKRNWNATQSEYAALKNAGINIRLDSNSELMHNKVAIIDSHIILTGSFNWSVQANEDNNENLVVLESQVWAAAFEVQFQQIYNAGS